MLDPRYSCVEIRFRIDCAAKIDCQQPETCPPPEREEPDINYLAKDYPSFRQLMLDRLAVVMPSWRERHVPDTGIALVEILAYAADQLSYYQDAVMTEAYLDTARLRTSVRRHARLVDYAMHDGCNARTFVALEVSADADLDPNDLRFVTRWTRDKEPPPGVREDDLSGVDSGAYTAFEPLVDDRRAPLRLRKAHNSIAIHTWGNEECCIPRGAIRTTLVDDHLDLRAGDFLLFEELACPSSAVKADVTNEGAPDADATHRHAVRLTNVTKSVDEVMELRLLEVEWSLEDALPFPLCISAIGRAPECELLTGLSVARGNIVPADHGTTIREALPVVPPWRAPLECEAAGELSDVAIVPGRYRPVPSWGPLTFSQPLVANASAARTIAQDPRAALPAIYLLGIPAAPSGEGPRFDPAKIDDPANAPLLTHWKARADLLDSGPEDAEFVAEVDDDGRAHLRFGDGVLGRSLAPGMQFVARYRTGNGRAGIVGPGALAHVAFRKSFTDVVTRVRNPLPASGAAEPEPIAEAKMLAAQWFRADLERAVTSDDYAYLAQFNRYPRRNRRVQNAAAQLAWNGSWYEGVALDAIGGFAQSDLLAEVGGLLHRFRRMGHDLRVGDARTVPIELEVEVCVDPHYLSAHVAAAIGEALSDERLTGGRRGFFHPDNLTFGAAIYISRIVAVVQAIDGVRSVEVKKLVRLGEEENPDFANGLLILGPLEIARLDNDPDRQENGILTIATGGGR